MFVAEITEYLDTLDPTTEATSPWPVADDGESLWEVDWAQVLDPEREADDRVPDEYADRQISEASRPSAGWDVCAWYQPIHFSRLDWGIYIRAECLESIAFQMAPYLFGHSSRLDGRMWWQLKRAAFLTVFLHEQYHHKVESFAIRLAVADRRAFYPLYSSTIYSPARGSNDLLEEALANADSYGRLDEPTYKRALGSHVFGVRHYLRDEFAAAPPGYRRAATLLDRRDFLTLENELCDQVHRGLAPASATAQRWRLASHMTRAFYSVRSETYVIVTGGGRSPLPGRPALSMSSAQVERLLRREGYAPVPGRGDHMKWERKGSPTIVVPKRRDLSPGVLADVARKLGLGNVYGLAAAMRGT
jgi:predicted RNA binding protein YcfA (HicA-like mRNA interferase family)